MSLLTEIKAALESASVTGGATEWTAYLSYIPDSPDKAIAIYDTGGESVDQSGGTKYDRPTFQLYIRGEAWGYEAARTKARDAFDALNAAEPSGYTYLYAVTPEPIPVRYDENNRPELSWNFRAMRERG